MNRNPRFHSINRRRELGCSNERVTREAVIGSTDFMQRLKLEAKLDIHRGCVNTISWNDSGYRILSGADDKHLCISDPYHRKKLTTIASGHRANIFSAKFMPCCNDSQIVSCSGDGQIAFNDVENTAQHGQHMFNCHYGTAYEVITVPNDPYTFLSCGEDGTVRWFDLRIKNKCMKEECREDVLINCRRAVTSLAINPIMPYHLGVGCSDSSVRVFDRRMLGTRSTGNYSGRGVQGMFCRFCPPHLQNKYSRPTSLQYSAAGNEILVSYSSDYIYLFATDAFKKEMVFERQEGLSETGMAVPAGSSFPDEDENPVVNPIKRLRLRGDWSDTGPKARPRGEQAESQPRLTIIQRMSEMLTRWLDDSTSSHARRMGSSTASSAEASNPQEQPMSNTPGPSSVQQSTSHFSSLQRTSTEEQAASTAVQQRLKDAMTARIKAKKQSTATDEALQSSTAEGVSSQNPPQDDKITTSEVSRSLDTAPEDHHSGSKKNESSRFSENQGSSENRLHKGSGQMESETIKSADIETVQAGSVEGISAISSSVQSCMQITPRKNRPDESCQVPNTEEHDDDGKGTQENDSKTDSKKRKRSPNSSASSSSLTDDPTLGRDDLDTPGKIRSKRNSKSQRKVTREGSGDSSNSSDSDSDKKVSGGDDKFNPLVSKSAEGNTGEIDCMDTRPTAADLTDNRDSLHGSRTKKHTEVETILNESKKQQSSCTELSQPEAEVQMDLDSNETTQRPPTALHDSSPILTTEPSISDSCNRDASSLEEDSQIGAGVASQKSENWGQVKSEEESHKVFALRDRREDTYPQERSTGQYSVTSQRQRRISVSGPAGTPPPSSDLASTSSQGAAPPPLEDSSETSMGAAASDVASGGVDLDSPSITCSESDSDDDLILRPPRLRRRHRHQSDEDDTRRPRPPSVTESRLRELFRARREAREKGEMQLSNVMMPAVKMVYKGHRNSRTMIKQANFWGNNFILSGSDCGHVFIWDRHTAQLVMLLEGDRHVVNCVQPHPFDHLLATSGIDYDVKLWSPAADVPCVPDDAAEVMRINELMLDETRDTITVPPSFMLRMLASLNHLREERRRSRESPSSSDSSDDDS